MTYIGARCTFCPALPHNAQLIHAKLTHAIRSGCSDLAKFLLTCLFSPSSARRRRFYRCFSHIYVYYQRHKARTLHTRVHLCSGFVRLFHGLTAQDLHTLETIAHDGLNCKTQQRKLAGAGAPQGPLRGADLPPAKGRTGVGAGGRAVH